MNPFNEHRPSSSRRHQGWSLLLLLLLFGAGALSFFATAGQAHAAVAIRHQAHLPQHVQRAMTSGCEGNMVDLHGAPYALCLTLASPCLRVRQNPSLSAPMLGCLSYGTLIDIACQTKSSSLVNGSPIWDKIQWPGSQAFVSDDYVNTGNYATFSPPIPRC